jgi:hypothetical protein
MNESRLTQLPGGVRAPPTSLVPSGESRPNVNKNRVEKVWTNKPIGPGCSVINAPSLIPEEVRGQRFTKKDQSVVRTDDLSIGGPRTDIGMAHIVTENTMKQTKRINPDTFGNPGRMNVRGGPLAAHGMVTSVRIDDNAFITNHGYTNVGYNRTGQQEINQYKEKPGTAVVYPLDLAKRQLEDNPFNHTLT